MIESLKRVVRNSYSLHKLYTNLNHYRQRIHNKNNVIKNRGGGRLLKDIVGANNKIEIGANSFLDKVKINIRGNNNQVLIGDNVKVGNRCSFFVEGNNIKIIIGKDTTFTQTCHFNAQEDNVAIKVGEDCMFSNSIIVRTSDSHPIYNMNTMQRLNPAADVVIGNHVWIAPGSIVMKGATIEDGCIIGSQTMVSKHIPSNTLAVGMPAKVVKEGVCWKRENLFKM